VRTVIGICRMQRNPAYPPSLNLLLILVCVLVSVLPSVIVSTIYLNHDASVNFLPARTTKLARSRLLIITLSVFAILFAALAPRFSRFLPFIASPTSRNMSATADTVTQTAPALPRTQEEWRAALDSLPSSTPNGIPAFYFAHGSPMLAMPQAGSHPRLGGVSHDMGPRSVHAQFLSDFGPALLEKYRPKGIVVFSAHWDEKGDRLGE
jgi:hypothetical protein